MNPSPASVPLVQCIGSDPAFLMLVEEAARKAFPDTLVQRCADFSAAVATTAETVGGERLLVLSDPAGETVEQACAAVDEAGLPRWAVVIVGAAPGEAERAACEVVAREDGSAWVARVLRAARVRHRLARENARLRGDLATFGFRIAHDLRTPLGGVVTTTEMLHEILQDVSPKHATFTDPVMESADGLVKLIDRMSFMAKAVASREAARPVEMMQPFWNAYQQMERALLAAGASLTHPNDWPVVKAHANWLEFVWRQLIANAIEHGGKGVKIEAGWEPVEGGYRFFLKDSGTVAQEKRAFLFHPFERLHEPGAPRGLGLPMVRRLVELDGGRCEFEALPGGGSKFSFVLREPGKLNA